MSKKKRTAERYAVNTKYQRKAEEAARGEQEKQERRAEAMRKNSALSKAYLYTIFIIFAVMSLYLLIRVLFFPVSSIQILRASLLLICVAVIPYLVVAAAVLVRRLNKKRRASYSERMRRLSGALFLLVILTGVFLYAGQLFFGRTDARGGEFYTRTVAALRESGLPVTEPEEAVGYRTLLEYTHQCELLCGQTKLVLNEHSSPYGWVAKRFDAQAARDYAAFPHTADNDLQIWGPAEDGAAARAAVVARTGGSIRIWELTGPAEELDQLIPLLKALGN